MITNGLACTHESRPTVSQGERCGLRGWTLSSSTTNKFLPPNRAAFYDPRLVEPKPYLCGHACLAAPHWELHDSCWETGWLRCQLSWAIWSSTVKCAPFQNWNTADTASAAEFSKAHLPFEGELQLRRLLTILREVPRHQLLLQNIGLWQNENLQV